MEDAEGYLGGDVLCSMGLIRSMLKDTRRRRDREYPLKQKEESKLIGIKLKKRKEKKRKENKGFGREVV